MEFCILPVTVRMFEQLLRRCKKPSCRIQREETGPMPAFLNNRSSVHVRSTEMMNDDGKMKTELKS